MIFEFFLHMSFGLPGPLWTELNDLKPASTNTPDAATLTLRALNWLKWPSIGRNKILNFPQNKRKRKNKMQQIWGAYNII